MTRHFLPTMLAEALQSGLDRTLIEDCGGSWRATGEQLLMYSRLVGEFLSKLESQESLVYYVDKGPLYYSLLVYSFLNSIDFCPIDKIVPTIRVAEIADALPTAFIFTDSKECEEELRTLAPHLNVYYLTLESLLSVSCKPITKNILSRRASYFIATSGSTGTPKLVRVPHENTIKFIDWAVRFYEIDQFTRWAQFSSVGFDLSLVDFLSTICGRGTLVSVSSRMDRLRPAGAINRGKITHWHSVPSMIPYFLNDISSKNSENTCRLFTFCGEALSVADAKGLANRYPGSRIVNTYGPTEGTLFCSFFDFDPNDAATSHWQYVPIGRPIPGWNFVLQGTENYKRLILISDYIADGYEGVTSDRFAVIQLFNTQTRAFDTGDYFCERDSQIFFSHRLDTMVKISGNRVDLGEIESIARDVGFQNPIAVLAENSILLLAEGIVHDVADRMSNLARRLPVHCVPREVKFLEEMPRTPNGKIDRLALNRRK